MFRHFMFQQEGGPCCTPRHMHHSRFGGHRERFERGFGGPGFGGGRERLFEGGELPLVILHLLAEQPSYPTLTLLEEEGFATAAVNEAAKKVYTISEEGKQHLQANKRRLDEVLARLEQAGEGFQRGRSPQIMHAFMNLRGAVKSRVSRQALSKEQLAKITDAINAAAKAIDEI